jgi:hypothetical protein
MLYKGITYYTKVSEPQVVQQVEEPAVEQSQFIEEK